jgi:hypothetical protein
MVIATIAHNFGVDVNILYFQFFPVILSVSLAATVLLATTQLHSQRAAFIALFLTFFGGSFAYLIPLFLPNHTWSESSFWVSQTFAMMINPQVIFSLATMALLSWLIQLDRPEIPNNTRHAIHFLIVLLVITSIGFKSYGWLVLGAIYGTYLLAKLLTTRSWLYLGWGVIVGLASLPTVWLITGFKASSFAWYPLWYLTSMIEAQDRVYYPDWRLQENFFRETGNLLGVARIRFQEFLVFIVGNLGTRMLMFALPLVWWRRLPDSKTWPTFLSLSAGFLFSASFPLFFIQQQTIWNSIQFWYYALIIANILVGVVMAEWYQRWQPGKALWTFILLVGIALTIPTYLKTQYGKVTLYQTIPLDSMKLLAQIPSDSHILICPSNKELFDSSFISAYTKAPVYLANPNQLSVTNNEELGKLKTTELFDLLEKFDPKLLRQFMRDTDTTHFLCNESRWKFMAEEIGNRKPFFSASEEWYLGHFDE